MILFDLICSQGHGFEAWFRDSDSFDRLVKVGEVQCAVCGDTGVRKALMAPNISTSKSKGRHAEHERVEDAASEVQASPETGEAMGQGQPLVPSPDAKPTSMVVQEKPGPLTPWPNMPQSARLPMPEKIVEAMKVLREVQSHIEKNFDHVGKGFAEEARKMHYGEAEKRSIYGDATKEEAQELAEEGIEVNQMPWLPNRNS